MSGQDVAKPMGRLAPSPTGAQHLGNARTYLLAYWSARKSGANLVMRIEDIDSPRVKPWATEQAIEDLRWLGIDWEFGPDVGGPHAPYIQTEREPHYHDAIERLRIANRVYPCVCTRKDIAAAASAPHFEHESPIYPGTCAAWQNGDGLPDAGTFSWRFRVTDDLIAFDDIVAGPQASQPASQLGDFPITQKNGKPSYQLAVVIDDAFMEVTEVVRGNDLIPSTFKQIELLRALDLPVPKYAHVPLVLGSDGRRLAKRHGDTRLSFYRERGVSPERIVAWAATSSGLIDQCESIQAAEVIAAMDWSKLNRDDFVVQDDLFGKDGSRNE